MDRSQVNAQNQPTLPPVFPSGFCPVDLTGLAENSDGQPRSVMFYRELVQQIKITRKAVTIRLLILVQVEGIPCHDLNAPVFVFVLCIDGLCSNDCSVQLELQRSAFVEIVQPKLVAAFQEKETLP
jgi:hypothetical protein